MKRLFSLLTAFVLAAALCAPVLADDTTNATPDPTPTPTATIDATNSDGVYVSAYTVTDTAGNEISTIEVGDRINIVLKVVDHASARYCVKPEEISTRINSAVFTYTGIGEIGQLFDNNDDPNATRLQNVRNGSASRRGNHRRTRSINYYSYVILFRDVIYNGGGNTLPINLSYLDTSKPLQQFSVTLGQCVDKDQTTSPNLLVRTSSYGDQRHCRHARSPLSLGLYATDGNENLNDVIVSLTLPENILLNSGSLFQLCRRPLPPSRPAMSPFEVMPSAGLYRHGGQHHRQHDRHRRRSPARRSAAQRPSRSPSASPTGLRSASWSCPAIRSMSAIPAASPSPMSTRAKTPSATLEARLTGTNLGAGSYQYLGNLNAGTEGSVDFDITPDAAGAGQRHHHAEL